MTEQEIRAAAYAIFSTETPLEDVFTSLNSAGFESEDICVFLSPTHPIADGVRNLNSGDSRSGAEVGVENTVSWLSTFGGVVIPGVGCFVGSREYLRALAQTDCRPETAANGAALTSLGIPRAAAERHQQRLRHDASLVFVSCEGAAKSEWAREILRRLRAEEVCLVGESEEAEKRFRRRGIHLVI